LSPINCCACAGAIRASIEKAPISHPPNRAGVIFAKEIFNTLDAFVSGFSVIFSLSQNAVFK
jgi:hypothetical protein